MVDLVSLSAEDIEAARAVFGVLAQAEDTVEDLVRRADRSACDLVVTEDGDEVELVLEGDLLRTRMSRAAFCEAAVSSGRFRFAGEHMRFMPLARNRAWSQGW